MAGVLAPDLLPLLLPHIDAKDRVTVREWCRSARSTFDQQRQRLTLQDKAWSSKKECPPLDFLLSTAIGIVRRGCRPQQVEMCLGWRSAPADPEDDLEELRTCGAALLRAFADAGFGQPGGYRGPSTLVLSAPLLIPSIALAIASVFPALEELRLDSGGRGGLDYREGAALLLGGSGGGAGGGSTEEHAGGEEGSGPLLPHLARVYLPFLQASDMGAACVAALSGRTTLRELQMELYPGEPAVAADLARMTQLRALKLSAYSGDASVGEAALPLVLAALTGLTQLSIDGQQMQLQGSVFAGMTALQELELFRVDLGVGGLQALSGLTSLKAGTLLPPPGVADTQQGPGAYTAASWPLPPQLRVLSLEGGWQSIEMLAALRPPAGLDCSLKEGCLQVVRGHHTTHDGVLLPAGEAALCGAIRLLAPSTPAISIAYVADPLDDDADPDEYDEVNDDFGAMALMRFPLRPVASAPAPGIHGPRVGPHHGAWLAALASLALTQLRLASIRLSVLDLKTIAQCLPALEVLSLRGATTYPLYALPHLAAGLPQLVGLELGAGPLVAAVSEAGVALSTLLTDPRFTGKVGIIDCEDDTVEEAVALLLMSLRGRMEEAGVDRLRCYLC